jgi:uncharacterized protein YndB with AHSA1/START domain
MTDYFTITRDLAAPRELVFDAITKPEHFAVWFGTAAVEVPQEFLHMDVRVGGAFRAVMVLPNGHQINWTGEYVEVDRPAKLAMTLSDDPEQPAGLPVLFDLAEIETGTRLTIRQDRHDFTDEQVAATIEGYNAFIDEIANELARMQAA